MERKLAEAVLHPGLSPELAHRIIIAKHGSATVEEVKNHLSKVPHTLPIGSWQSLQ